MEYIRLDKASQISTSIGTRLPIQLDATCNGYQHLSMLSRDGDLGSHLYLMESTNKDIPNDFYGLLTSRITTLLEREIEEYSTPEEDFSYPTFKENSNKETKIESYKRIINFGLNRSIIKKPVMVESYNASSKASVEHLKKELTVINEPSTYISLEEYKEFDVKYVLKGSLDNSKYLIYKDLCNIVDAIKGVLKEDYPKLTLLRLYLKDIGRVCNTLDITIPWTLPSGLTVDQSYLVGQSVKSRPLPTIERRLL